MRNGGYYKSIETYDYAAKHVEEICLLSNPHTFKVQASAGKIMCNVFWDAVDPVASLGWVTPGAATEGEGTKEEKKRIQG